MGFIHILPFEDQHVPQAATLLAQRHRQERVGSPLLPQTFEQPQAARKALEAARNRPRVTGFAAMDADRLLGFLIGYETATTLMGRTAWIPLAGHAAEDPEIYHELYAALAKVWVRRGIFDHYVMAAASNRAALDKWFALSFGMQQAYGLLPLEQFNQPERAIAGLTIRRANPDDKAIAAELSSTNVVYQMDAPVFAPSPPEQLDEVRDGYVEALEDDSIFFLAFLNGEAAGYQIYYPAETDDTTMMQPPNTIELPAGGTRPGYRGQGIGSALTRHALLQARAAGYAYCLTDWRTTNPLASRFWPKIGFVPVAYRLTRHIDERIAWAAGASDRV